MYNAMFAASLRLPLTKLHRQLANYLGLSVSQIAPNAWRIFLRVEVIWGQLSSGNHRLTLDEFFYYYRPQQITSSKGIYHFLARKTSLRLVSDMLDLNRNQKNIYFFVQGTAQVCRPEEWDSMPDEFNNTWGIVRESGVSFVFFISTSSASVNTYTFCCFQLRSVRRLLTSRRALLGVSWRFPSTSGSGKIQLHLTLSTPSVVIQCQRQKPVDCKLIPTVVSSFCLLTRLAYLFLFLTPTVVFLYFFVSEMDAGRQMVLVRKAATAHKQQEQASGSAPNVAPKATFKRKNNAKDDRPSNKGTSQLIGEKQQKASSPPPPPSHGARKGLMTGKGLVAPNPIQRLVTHKDYVVEMVSSIIKEMDLDPYGEHSSEDLGVSGLYDLSRVCLGHLHYTSKTFLLILTVMLCLKHWCA